MQDQNPDRPNHVPSRGPADGERRAITGYLAQYRVAAELILRALREGTLSWIRVGDPRAGRVDDIQIGRLTRVDAYQVKWSTHPGTITFSDFTRPSPSAPSLLRQLVDGWKLLSRQHSTHRVVVHFLTNDSPSPSPRAFLPIADPPPVPQHFAAFLSQQWQPDILRQVNSLSDVAHEWRPVWEAIREASALEEPEFLDFVKNCQLECGYRLQVQDPAIVRDEELWRRDLDLITQSLLTEVADPSRVIQIDRAALLQRWGLTARLHYRSSHHFPVDTIRYVPIAETVRCLDQALDRCPGGYVALLGSPGSGKSTLLAATMRQRQERVISYFAYVPDAREPTVLRGESVNFLHDVVLALESAGITTGRSLPAYDRDHLLERFHEQLSLLHTDFAETGRKTLIVIDGLDHIEREQKPQRSLLRDLPSPQQVPDGVYIVLGSQTDEPFPDSIQFSVRESQRRVEMQPLSRESVRLLIGRSSLRIQLSDAQQDEIYTISGGHPLATIYLLALLGETEATQVAQRLSDAKRFGADIESHYHSYWNAIRDLPELVHCFGLLARVRGAIDIPWLSSWATPELLRSLERVRHLFIREAPDRWHFFHNSFRLYLQEHTALSVTGDFDPEISHRLHLELASICNRTPPNNAVSWDVVYHLSQANEHGRVLALAQPAWFREQLYRHRPTPSIRTDVQLALRSAAAEGDLVALTRLVLADDEMRTRQESLGEADLQSLLLDLGDTRAACEQVRDGNRLRVPRSAALRFSVLLATRSLHSESRRVFDLAEPLGELSARETDLSEDYQDERGSELAAWARAAFYHRDLDAIVATVQRIHAGASRLRTVDAVAATGQLRHRLLLELGLSIVDNSAWPLLERIVGNFDRRTPDGRRSWFSLHADAWNGLAGAGDLAKARSMLNQVAAASAEEEPTPHMRVELAEGFFRICRDSRATRSWLQDVPQPELRIDLPPQSEGLQPFMQRFRLNRLLRALGVDENPSDIVRLPTDPRCLGIAYFERALCHVAHIEGDAWRGRRLAPSEIRLAVGPLMRFFHRGSVESRDWLAWHEIQALRDAFFALLVESVAAHGMDSLEQLRLHFVSEWSGSESPQWPPQVRREVLLSLYRNGISRAFVAEELLSLESDTQVDQEVEERIREHRSQASAWLVLGDSVGARRSIQRLIQNSFGVGYRKDYQLSTWIRWMSLKNRQDPGSAGQRIKWFALAARSLKKTTEGQASVLACEELLGSSMEWSPRSSLRLLEWLQAQALLNLPSGLAVLLAAAIQRDPSSAALARNCLSKLLLPMSRSGFETLAATVVKAISTTKSVRTAVDWCREFLRAVDVYGLPSTRRTWRRGVARGLMASGIELEAVDLDRSSLIASTREAEYSSEHLTLRDGARLCAAEVAIALDSVDALAHLLSNEAEGSYFDWPSSLGDFITSRTVNELRSLRQSFRSHRQSARLLGVLGECLAKLGHREEAWDVGSEALRLSSSHGWYRWVDGGTRLAAFRALVAADRERGRSLLLETLLADKQASGQLLLDVLPLLTNELPIAEVWDEIQRHLGVLFEASGVLHDSTLNFSDNSQPDDVSAAVSDLSVLLLSHPALVVAQGAQAAILSGLLDQDNDTLTSTRKVLISGDERREALLQVLEATANRNVQVLESLGSEIAALQDSPDFSLRRPAIRLSISLGLGSTRPVEPRVLGAIYDFVLPLGSGLLSVRREKSSQEVLPDSDDPFEIVRPFDVSLEILGKATGISYVSLCHRAVQIMHQLKPFSEWDAEAERALRSRMVAMGLRLPFRRPRASLARRAVSHVIAELVDAGKLDHRSELLRDFQYYDPVMFFCDPEPRPAFIKEMHKYPCYGDERRGWLHPLGDYAASVLLPDADGLIILAEWTERRVLDWETRNEIRTSGTVSVPASGEIPSELTAFASVEGKLVADYSDMTFPRSMPALVVQNSGYRFDSPHHDWLAFRPDLGILFGWIWTGDSDFAWVDAEGQVMVRTRRWLDGLSEHSPPSFDDEVGSGWMVLATPAAINIIRNSLGHLVRILAVERSLVKDGERRSDIWRGATPIG